MLKKKTIAAALACALALGAFSGSALATPVTVGGVHFDPDSGFDLTIKGNLRESSVSGQGETLTGYGLITEINSTNPDYFCPNCDLTFTFSYTVSNIDTSGTNPQIKFNGGSIQLYVSPDGSYDSQFPETAGTGSLWLDLEGHVWKTTQGDFSAPWAELYSTIHGTPAEPTSGSQGFGMLDAIGGPAESYIDTNFHSDGLGGFADLRFASSFFTKPFNSCESVSSDADDVCHYPISGTGTLIGDARAVTVPEPGALGLLGLGLGGLGLLIWRRRKEAEGRA